MAGRSRPCGDYFHRAFAQSPWLRLWWSAHRSDWLHSLAWRGSLSVRVEGAGAPERTAAFDAERTVAVLLALAERGALLQLGEKSRAALRCPSCGAAMKSEHDRISCRDCQRVYPAPGGVPVLVEEAAGS